MHEEPVADQVGDIFGDSLVLLRSSSKHVGNSDPWSIRADVDGTVVLRILQELAAKPSSAYGQP
jgi:hypothetical protein